MRVHFKRANGAKVTLDDVDAAAHTVRETRARVVSAMATDGGVDSEASTTVRLIFKGRVMKDDATLDAYGVTEESVVHVVVSSAMKTTSSSSVGGGGASAAATNPGMNPANTSPSPAAAGFGGFGGAAGFGGFGDAAGFGGAAQTPPNPEAMRAMLSNPFVRSQLDALLNENPETLRELVESQPGLREAMDANPQLRSALSDPATLRQMFNAATNPSLMAEQMRSNDRAMSNISSMPGGFDALRRMYTDVQQPMERAQERSAADPPTTGTPNTNPDGPIPNPWGAGAGAAGGDGGDGGFSGAGGFGGAGGDPIAQMEQMAQMMSNPQMRSAMENVMSNPQMMEAMLGSHPEARRAMEANPQLRETLTNPDFMRQMMNPENLRAMAQMQQAFNTLQGNNAFGGGDLGGLGAAFGGGAFGGAPPAPAGPPEEVYATQLSQLNDMGFFDAAENIRALQATGGNVHAAVERLLSGGSGSAFA